MKDISETLERVTLQKKEIEQGIKKKNQAIINNYIEQRKKIESRIEKYKERYQGETQRSFLRIVVGNLAIAPVIYAMVIPIFIFDTSIFVYQHIAFRIYGIPIVKRKEYFVIDRHRLEYLNVLEKFNCVYCGYGNGVAAYGKEIIARTEQYWCPIKHEKEIKDPHTRYENFFEYGDGKGYQENISSVVRKYDKEK